MTHHVMAEIREDIRKLSWQLSRQSGNIILKTEDGRQTYGYEDICDRYKTGI